MEVTEERIIKVTLCCLPEGAFFYSYRRKIRRKHIVTGLSRKLQLAQFPRRFTEELFLGNQPF
jgi:hypothetical protein